MRVAAASAICPKAPTIRPITAYVAKRPMLKSSLSGVQRTAGVAHSGNELAVVHIAT